MYRTDHYFFSSLTIIRYIVIPYQWIWIELNSIIMKPSLIHSKPTLDREKQHIFITLCFILHIGFSALNPSFSQVSQWTTCLADGCKGTNLITNGGFEDHPANTGSLAPNISTEFGMVICPPAQPEDLWGNVLIAVNPLICYPLWTITDHTFGNGTGKMMLVDFPDSSPLGGAKYIDIWATTIFVDSGKIYCFGAWFKNLNSDTALSKPNFRYLVDNTLIGVSPELEYDSTNAWTFYGFVYTSTTVTISIENGKWGGEGNDLAMDDIEFREITNGTTPPVAMDDDGGIMGYNSIQSFYVTNNDTLNTNAPVSNNNVSIYSVSPDTLGTAWVNANGSISFSAGNQIGSVQIVYEYCQPNGCCDMAVLYFLLDTILSNNWIHQFNGKWSYGSIHLNWQSSDEPEKVTYELRRSFDQKNYTKVASISYLPNQGEKYYRYLDTGIPFNGEGFVYYELTAFDHAGNRYPPLQTQIKITNPDENTLKFRVFPNPSNSDILNIIFIDPVVRGTEIYLSNMNGQVMKKLTLIGQNKVKLDIQNLPMGMYLISASDGRVKETLKFQHIH